MGDATEYNKEFALRVAGLEERRDILYPVVYRFRSTVDADDYMRKHVKALEIQGDTIFREVESDIPAPVAIHDETCCMLMVDGTPKFVNPHPECLGIRVVAGQQVLDMSTEPK